MKQAEAIIANASALRALQPIHIRQILKTEDELSANFEVFSKDKPEYADPATKTAAKEKYIADTKRTIATEIVTDYTALYLQSDGSFEGFFDKCYSQMSNEGKKSFGLTLRAMNQFYARLSNATTENKARVLAELQESSPPFAELAKNYGVFYKEIQKSLVERNNSLLEKEELEGDDLDDMMSEIFLEKPGPEQVPEPAAGGPDRSDQKTSKQETKFSIFAFIKAFAEEVKLETPGLEKQ
jgi:hypothetical protein